MALNNQFSDGVRRNGLKLVSDNGSQPTSCSFMQDMSTLGIEQIFTSYKDPQGSQGKRWYWEDDENHKGRGNLDKWVQQFSRSPWIVSQSDWVRLQQTICAFSSGLFKPWRIWGSICQGTLPGSSMTSTHFWAKVSWQQGFTTLMNRNSKG